MYLCRWTAADLPRSEVRTLGNFINGAQAPPAAGRYLDVLEPATGQVTARVPAGDATDVAQAVDAATAAFPAWSESPAAFGYTEDGRYIIAVFDFLDDMTIVPSTAYEVPEPR